MFELKGNFFQVTLFFYNLHKINVTLYPHLRVNVLCGEGETNNFLQFGINCPKFNFQPSGEDF